MTKPDEDDDGPATPTPPPAAAPSPAARWDTATTQVRTTAQWVITTLGAIAGVVFGAGPIIGDGELKGDNLGWRVFGLIACAVVGAGAVTYLIARVARVLLPYETRLSDLDGAFVAKVEQDADQYLPAGLDKVAKFRIELLDRGRLVRTNGAAIGRLEFQLARSKAKLDEADIELATAKDDLADVVERLKGTSGDTRANLEQRRNDLEAKIGKLEKRIDEIKAARDLADTELGIRKGEQLTLEKNIEIFRSAKDELLAQAAYAQSSNRFTDRWMRFAMAPVLAVAAGTGYLLLWSYQPDSGDTAGGGAELVELVQTDDPAAARLWDDLGLGACGLGTDEDSPRRRGPFGGDTDRAATRIPVLLDDGDGTPDDPYHVTTLGAPEGCPSISFLMEQRVGMIIEPEKPAEVTVTYDGPDPTPTPPPED